MILIAFLLCICTVCRKKVVQNFWMIYFTFFYRETIGREYCYCVDKMTEDLKIPRFFVVFPLQYLVSWLCFVSKLLSIQAVLSRSVLLNTTEIQICCVEKDWRRQDSLDREQLCKETQPRNEVLGIHWAQKAQFELKSSWRGNTTKKKDVFSRLLLFYQHNNNTRYLSEIHKTSRAMTSSTGQPIFWFELVAFDLLVAFMIGTLRSFSFSAVVAGVAACDAATEKLRSTTRETTQRPNDIKI